MDTETVTNQLGAGAAFDYDPTQMQDVIYKLDELINALRRV